MTPTVEYVDFVVDGATTYYTHLTLPIGFLDKLSQMGKDEPWPLNLSRYFWLMSQQSQRCFEARVIQYGRN